MALHIFSGLIIFTATVVMSLIAMENYMWTFRWDTNLHSAFGFAVLFAVTLITILGFIAWFLRIYRDKYRTT